MPVGPLTVFALRFTPAGPRWIIAGRILVHPDGALTVVLRSHRSNDILHICEATALSYLRLGAPTVGIA